MLERSCSFAFEGYHPRSNERESNAKESIKAIGSQEIGQREFTAFLTLISPERVAFPSFTARAQDEVHLPLQKFFRFILSPVITTVRLPFTAYTPTAAFSPG